MILSEGSLDFFEIQTRMGQGFMLSQLLFLILIDYVCIILEKTEKIWQTAKRLGLEINAPKTKVMRFNTTLDATLTITGETLECVESFKNRLRKAFASLRPVSIYSMLTKLKQHRSLNPCCCTDRSAGWFLKRISIRSRHFRMDAFVGSV